MTSNSLQNQNGFKLISLELRGNSLMGKSELTYNFIDPKDKQDSLYTTVIIGPNGSGKSNLFRIIIELFKELFDLSKGKNRNYSVDGMFNLKFAVNKDIFEYTNIIYADGTFKYDGQPELDVQNPDKNNRAYLKLNGKRVEFLKAFFPLSIVANSIMVTDKFPFFRKEEDNKGEKQDPFPIYKYLGVRSLPQIASTRAYVRRTVEFIADQFEKKNNNQKRFIHALKKATDFLELENYIDIFYTTSNTAKFFKGDLDEEKLNKYFEDIRNRYAKINTLPPFKLSHYLKIRNNEKLLEEICNFCNMLVKETRLIKLSENSSSRKFSYNLFDQSALELLNSEYSILEHLRQLGMIYSPEIQLKRKEQYSLQESSSGEYHFFSSIVSLMATVETNSLIFIDEPEIRLHPNWQMKYLSFVRELFGSSEYATCHMLVATHSHFLISDLKGENSKIIGLKRLKGNIEIINLPTDIDTFGWSPDDILYNIFDVTSTRNKFIAEDIANILNTLSKGNKDTVNKIDRNTYDTLIHLEKTLKDIDPLKEVVKSILKKVN